MPKMTREEAIEYVIGTFDDLARRVRALEGLEDCRGLLTCEKDGLAEALKCIGEGDQP